MNEIYIFNPVSQIEYKHTTLHSAQRSTLHVSNISKHELGKVNQRNIINTGSNNMSWRHTDMQVYATEHIVTVCSKVMIFNSMPQSLSEVDI